MKSRILLFSIFALLIIVSCTDKTDDLENGSNLDTIQDQLFQESDVYTHLSEEEYRGLFLNDTQSKVSVHLPVLEAIRRNYDGAKISGISVYMSSVSAQKRHYSIFLSTGVEVVVFQGGQVLAEATIESKYSDSERTAGELPFYPLLRIYSEHGGDVIEEVTALNTGRFEIDFKSGLSIELDTEGKEEDRGGDDNGDDDGTIIDPSLLPQEIHDYVAATYPGETIIRAEAYPNGFEVLLSSGVELEFDLDGNFIEISGGGGNGDVNGEDGEDIDPSELPQTILNFITTNYPDAVIVNAEIDMEGYDVTLSNGLKLEFDLDGNFIEVSGHSDDDNDDDDDDDEVIDPNTLPQVILDFIRINYPDESIVRAEVDAGGYDVILSNGLKLEFDLDGRFIEVSGGTNGDDDDDDDDFEDGEDIDPSLLPSIILDFITQVCPDETIVNAQLLMSGGYEVSLSNGLQIEFDDAGEFVDISGSDCDEIDIEETPQTILNWVEANFAAAIDRVKQCDYGYRIDLEDDQRIWLKSNGDVIFIGIDD